MASRGGGREAEREGDGGRGGFVDGVRLRFAGRGGCVSVRQAERRRDSEEEEEEGGGDVGGVRRFIL